MKLFPEVFINHLFRRTPVIERSFLEHSIKWRYGVDRAVAREIISEFEQEGFLRSKPFKSSFYYYPALGMGFKGRLGTPQRPSFSPKPHK